jgi:hypothetical protein
VTPSPRRAAALLASAVAITLASSAVDTTRLEVQDWDCPPAPQSCARPVVVAGFPLPYISDYHGISPVGSADLVGAALGMDRFHLTSFLLDMAFYMVALGVIDIGWRALRKRRRGESTGAGGS